MNVDPAAEPEFNEWYNAEHLPQLGAVPGVLCARRYSSSAADRERKYLALYHMTGPGRAECDAWKKAANTPWTAAHAAAFPRPAGDPLQTLRQEVAETAVLRVDRPPP